MLKSSFLLAISTAALLRPFSSKWILDRWRAICVWYRSIMALSVSCSWFLPLLLPAARIWALRSPSWTMEPCQCCAMLHSVVCCANRSRALLRAACIATLARRNCCCRLDPRQDSRPRLLLCLRLPHPPSLPRRRLLPPAQRPPYGDCVDVGHCPRWYFGQCAT